VRTLGLETGVAGVPVDVCSPLTATHTAPRERSACRSRKADGDVGDDRAAQCAPTPLHPPLREWPASKHRAVRSGRLRESAIALGRRCPFLVA